MSSASSADLTPRRRPRDETRSGASSSRQAEPHDNARLESARLRSSAPDQAATNFDTSIAHWVGQEREPPPPRAKLPSSKHAHLSANFLYKSKDPGSDALCTKARRGEAGKRIIKVKNSKKETALDLENLGLTGVPARIGELSHIKELNLSFNKLKSLPPQFEQLGRLKILQAGGLNEFSSFPPVILKLENLVHLDLSGNRMRKVPRRIGDLVNLTRLHLDSNYLENLPRQLYRLSKLQAFSAASNPFLSTVPADMGQLTQLRRVDLSNTQIATLPKQWNQVIEESMISLNLSRTNFSGFDDRLQMPKRMKLLDISNTFVATLPPKFGSLTFYGNAEGNILRTMPRRLWEEELKIKVEGTNLPAELDREGRMMTKQPIPKLTPLRHELRRPPHENQDNDVDSGSDDGGDIDFHMRWLGDTGPVNLAHAERVRAAAANRLPTGRAADFAAERAAEEFADRWGAAPAQPASLYPWGNAPVPEWPGPPGQAGMQPFMQPFMQQTTQQTMPWGMQAAPQMAGRWANRFMQPGNPAYAEPPAPPIQAGMGWWSPSMPSMMGFVPPAAAAQPGMGSLNAFAHLLSLGATPVPAASLQNAPPVSGAAQPPGATPAQGIFLSPPVAPGGRMPPPPLWAAQPTSREVLGNAASSLAGNMAEAVAGLADNVSFRLRGQR